MKQTILFFCFFLIGLHANAQNAQGCDGKRYVQDLFTDYTITTEQYGYNVTITGNNFANLLVDIYQPKGDVLTKRPLVIFAFGGGLVSGRRTDPQIVQFCQEYTKKGFVCASIDYRLWDKNTEPDTSTFLALMVAAQQDMRAAVRFFKKDAKTMNKYAIDTNNIIVGGYSSGALTAMNVGYLSTSSPISIKLSNIIDNIGGIEGNSGNTGFSSRVKGVISLSGAIYRKEFITKNAPPFIAYHGSADTQVLIGSGLDDYGQFWDGDKSCVDYAKSLGIPTVLFTVPGGDHIFIYQQGSIYGSYLTRWKSISTTFLKQLVCGETINVETPTEEISSNLKFDISPNPSHDFISVKFQDLNNTVSGYSFDVYDVTGKLLIKYSAANKTEIQINKFDLGQGVFFVKCADKTGNSAIQKIVFLD